MPDKFSKEKRSEIMAKIKSQGSKIEIKMKEALEQKSIEFEYQPKLYGKPDFLIKPNITVFCDSSFWHGRRREDVNGSSFRKNKEFWSRKLATTRRRDRLITQKLKGDGWTVLRFWDTDVLRRTDFVRDRLRRVLNAEKHCSADGS